METVIMPPESKEQLAALKAFAKALKIKFETSTYNSESAKVHKSKKEADEGRLGRSLAPILRTAKLVDDHDHRRTQSSIANRWLVAPKRGVGG